MGLENREEWWKMRLESRLGFHCTGPLKPGERVCFLGGKNLGNYQSWLDRKLLKSPFPFQLHCVFLLAVPCCMWDLISLTRDGTAPPAVEVRSLNHWTTMEVLSYFVKKGLQID